MSDCLKLREVLYERKLLGCKDARSFPDIVSCVVRLYSVTDARYAGLRHPGLGSHNGGYMTQDIGELSCSIVNDSIPICGPRVSRTSRTVLGSIQQVKEALIVTGIPSSLAADICIYLRRRIPSMPRISLISARLQTSGKEEILCPFQGLQPFLLRMTESYRRSKSKRWRSNAFCQRSTGSVTIPNPVLDLGRRSL